MSDCKPHPQLADFQHWDHDPPDPDVLRGHCVYRAPREGYEGRKPIIVLHELYGLSAECAELARRLVAEGFAVNMPVLFGSPLGSGLTNALRMCISREFTLLRTNKTSRIADWVRSLTSEVAAQHSGSKVGAIGMCLTAHLMFPLVLEQTVGAVVASQSAMPWIGPPKLGLDTPERRASLGVSPSVVDDIKSADNPAALCALRFNSDPISPPERMATVQQVLPSAVIRPVDDPPGTKPGLLRPHSVLTAEYDPEPASDTHRAFREVVEFFATHL